MKLPRRTRRPIPGQSRPDGFHFERIPVREPDPETGELPTGLLVADGAEPVSEHDAQLAKMQFELGALRQAILSLGRQLDTAKAEAESRAAVIRDRESRLRVARQKLSELGAPRTVLDTLTPPTWHDDHPVTDRPERR